MNSAPGGGGGGGGGGVGGGGGGGGGGGEGTTAAKREAECAEVGELVASLLDCSFFFDARNFEVRGCVVWGTLG